MKKLLITAVLALAVSAPVMAWDKQITGKSCVSMRDAHRKAYAILQMQCLPEWLHNTRVLDEGYDRTGVCGPTQNGWYLPPLYWAKIGGNCV